MKRSVQALAILFVLLSILGFSHYRPIPGTAALPSLDDTIDYCGFDDILREAEAANSPVYQKQQALEHQLYQILQNNPEALNRNPENEYTVPVVVHIVHNNGPENISDAQVLQGIEHLNQAFANTAYYDQGTGLDMGIRFCLARRNPDGNLTTGITRDVSPLTDMVKETEDLLLKNINRWDPDCYMNVWLVKSIRGLTSGPGIVGYATLPGAHGGLKDGIVMEAEWLGSSPANSAVIIHEAGHYLGLYHTFQGGCTNNDCLSDGDQVCDTPPDNSTAPVPCSQPPNSCNTDVNSGFTTDQNDMINNYMDYGDFNCYNAFTQGQKDRMEFFLTGIRASLLNCPSCLDPCPVTISVEIQEGGIDAVVGQLTSVSAVVENVTQYQWFVDGQPVSDQPELQFTFQDLNAHTIILQGTNDNPDCLSADTVLVTPICSPVSGISIQDNNIDAPLGTPVTINTQASNVNSFQWFVNGQLEGNTQNLAYTFLNDGLYEIVVEGIAYHPLCNVYDTIFITPYCPVSVAISTGQTQLTPGETAIFYSDTSHASSIEWYVNGIPVGTAEALEYTFPTPGAYEVYSEATGQLCSQRSESIFIYVEEACFYGRQPLLITFGLQGFGWQFLPGSNNETTFITSEGVVQLNSQLQPTFSIMNLIGEVTATIRDPFTGGYIQLFSSLEGYFRGNSHLQKIAPDGTVLWNKELAENQQQERYLGRDSRIIPTTDSNFVIVANFDYQTTSIDKMSLVCKISPEGTLLWKREYDKFAASNIIQTADEGFLIVGSPTLNAPVGLIKTDAFGNIDWQYDYVPTNATATTYWLNGFQQLRETDDGHYLLTYNVQVEPLPANRKANFMKVDQNGICIWNKELDVAILTGTLENNEALVKTENGNFLFSVGGMGSNGRYVSTHGKITQDGQILWLRQLDTAEEYYIWGINVLSPDEIVYSGNLSNQPMLLFTNGQGLSGECAIINPDYDIRNVPYQESTFSIIPSNVFTLVDAPVNFENLPVSSQILCSIDGINGFEASFQIEDAWSCGDSLYMNATVCNAGNQALEADVPVSFYDDNPTQVPAAVLATIPFDGSLPPDSCATFTLALPFIPQSPKVFCIINDDGALPRPFNLADDFPVTPDNECNFFNNLDSLALNELLPAGPTTLNLGPDALLCPGETLLLRANAAFTTFSWQDGSANSILIANTPGLYSLTATNFCGRLFTDTILLKAPSELSLSLGPDITICQNDVFTLEATGGFTSYVWQDGFTGPSYTAWEPGAYWVDATDECGFVHSDTVSISLDPNFSFELGDSISICRGDSVSFNIQSNYTNYRWHPNRYLPCDDCPQVTFYPDSTTRYTLVAEGGDGCLSADTITITVNQPYETFDTLSLCEGDSVLLFGQLMVFEAGTYTGNLLSRAGCDSMANVTVQVLENVVTESTISTCQGAAVDIFGSPQSAAGIYSQTFAGSNGCDSIHQVELVLLDTFSTSEMLQICSGESIELFGQSVISAGTYSATFTANNGCDSTHTIILQIQDTVTTAENRTICQGESTDVFGASTYLAGSYAATFTAASGCDSVHTITLTVLDTTATFENRTICQGDTADIFGNPESAPGIYAAAFTAANGCDSSHYISLQVFDTIATFENQTICQGETADIFGNPESAPGIYATAFTAANRCDSSHYISLQVLDTIATFENRTICQGETADIFGNPESTEGIYFATFTAASGCDSSHYISLQVSDTVSTSESRIICRGESTGIFGTFTTEPGNYSAAFTSASGCDSIHTITLTVLDTTATFENRTICQGETAGIFGNPESAPGIYAATFTAANGCDSSHYISLQVLDTIATFESRTICQGETADIFGNPESTEGIYSATFTAASGCDSTHHIQLSVLPPAETELSWSICPGDSVLIFGDFISTPGIYQEAFTSANGCDSISTIELSLSAGMESSIQMNPTCFGQSTGSISLDITGGTPPYTYLWGHTNVDSPSLSALGAGVYPVTVTSQDGCALELVATVTEYSFPAFSLLIEDVSCFGQNDGAITIVSGQAGLRFGLNAPPTDTSHQFGMLESGTHILYIEDSIGCIFEEPITLQEPQPLSISLPEEIEAALGDSVLLSAGSALPSGSTFAWQPPDGLSCTDCSAPLAAPGENTVYQLIVTSVEGCRAEAEVLVLIDRTTKVYIPNAFSPNEDGRNDTFRPYAKGNWAVRSFSVFSRWGNLVFEENEKPVEAVEGWDGNVKGNPMPQGIYTYLLEAEAPDGKVEQFSGEVLLIR